MPEKTKGSLIDRLSANLVSEGLVTKEQLSEAERTQCQTGQSLGRALVDLHFLSREELIAFVARQLEIPHIDLTSYIIEAEVIDILPEATARKYKLIPMFRVEDTIQVAMADPVDVFAIDDIKLQVGLEVKPVLADEEDILKAIDQYYGGTHLIEETIEGIKETSWECTTPKRLEAEELERVTEQPPIVKLVNQLILEAVSNRASDIHLEPQRKEMIIRNRVDGILHKVSSIPKHLQLPVISRIKVMADLDLTERRLPQDGRIQTRLGEKVIDMRVSTFPTMLGEKVVMRILDKGAISLDLAAVGFSSENLKIFRALITEPSGLIFISGPTGSGKTSTLYAALRAINSPEKNIVTLEEPVEYEIDYINQGGINVKAGLTFARGLRSILRQDPDVIMVGEVRDFETAELAIRAALTGHLVLSTLHTIDAAGCLTRLIDMGVEPFLISSSVIGVVAQRLVRTICPKCKEEHISPGLSDNKEIKSYKGRGCKECRNTGYKGRTGLYEIIILDENIKKLIMAKTPASSIKEAVRKCGARSLREEGLSKARAGITTIEEVLRETPT